MFLTAFLLLALGISLPSVDGQLIQPCPGDLWCVYKTSCERGVYKEGLTNGVPTGKVCAIPNYMIFKVRAGKRGQRSSRSLSDTRFRHETLQVWYKIDKR